MAPWPIRAANWSATRSPASSTHDGMEQLRFPRPRKKQVWNAVKRVSNHCHVVLRSDPKVPSEWTDREFAERWLAVFPGSISNREDPACIEKATLALLGNSERLDVIRQRLSSICNREGAWSWF